MPFLRLQGRWLHKAGFAIGTPVRILVTPGRLVLEVEERTTLFRASVGVLKGGMAGATL
ncbi:MAG: SymE family type I addiction module toxin [Gammaproteobacteria bacterium]|nr:SymE family type I addiction module toxin [Gammaproteobacteria bacterium]